MASQPGSTTSRIGPTCGVSPKACSACSARTGTTSFRSRASPSSSEKWKKMAGPGAIPVPGNVSYNGYMATRELLRAIERARSANNIKVIRELENLKVSAADRMQQYDAYMDPTTHQLQQTIYLARRNMKLSDDTDMFEI